MKNHPKNSPDQQDKYNSYDCKPGQSNKCTPYRLLCCNKNFWRLGKQFSKEDQSIYLKICQRFDLAGFPTKVSHYHFHWVFLTSFLHRYLIQQSKQKQQRFSGKKPSPISYDFMGEGFFVIWNF